MSLTEFKVTFPQKELIVYVGAFSIIETAFIVMIFTWEYVLLSIVFAISFFLIGLLVLLASVLFCVKVNSSRLKVRTRLGKQYAFTCSEIEKVSCSKRTSVKYGPIYYITILTKSHKLDLEGTMTGFKKMAEFVLEMHTNGDIRNKAISENSRRMLVQYKNGDIFKKKQRNK